MSKKSTEAPDRSNAPTLSPRHSAALSIVLAALAAFQTADAELTGLNDRLAEARGRDQALRDKLAELDRQKPAEPRTFTAEHAARLAADPTADLSVDDDMDDRRRIYRASLADWTARRNVYAEAKDKTAAECLAWEPEIQHAATEREKSWHAFVKAAHGWLLVRFVEGFELLRAELIEPMSALEGLRTTSGTQLLNPYSTPRVSSQSKLLIDRYLEPRHEEGKRQDHHLLSDSFHLGSPAARRQVADAEAQIGRIVADLGKLSASVSL